MSEWFLHPLWIVVRIGLGFAGGFLFVYWTCLLVMAWRERRKVAALYEASMIPPKGGTTSHANRSAGAMTDGEREFVIRELLWHWSRGSVACFDETSVMKQCGLTKAQAVAFMHWARGQVLKPGLNTYRCIVEQGVETQWLRFQAVGEVLERKKAEGGRRKAEGGVRS